MSRSYNPMEEGQPYTPALLKIVSQIWEYRKPMIQLHKNDKAEGEVKEEYLACLMLDGVENYFLGTIKNEQKNKMTHGL